MTRTMMAGLIQGAEAQVYAEINACPFKLGEFPDIQIGAIAGRAVDFLRKSAVPVKGFSLNLAVELSIEVPDKEPFVETIPIIQSKPISETRDLVRTAADAFAIKYKRIPDQRIVHSITFFIDETQIKD